ncbi:MAG: discoidin domain-containing protein [Bacteroidales bacterium]|nr:discoidin domain-containing protein [Bacteroidales bacterium]
MRSFIPALISCALALAYSVPSSAQETPNSLREGFIAPPKEARPRVWWHWMNGNITKDGIRKDLLWMKDAGIVGYHNFDAGLETPRIVEKRIPYMTPEWKECFNYALDLSDSLDMEVTIAASPGWSETGGPWVSEEDAMKKLVWRQVDVTGSSLGNARRTVGIPLPEGFDITGKFQDLPMAANGLEAKFSDLRFYRDIAVVAVRLCDDDLDFTAISPTVSTSGTEEPINSSELLKKLNSDSVGDFINVKPKDGWSWVQYAFEEPQTIRSVIITEKKVKGTESVLVRELQCSDDGIDFRTVSKLDYQATQQKTYSFPPVTAKFFRIRFRDTEEGQESPFGVSQFILSSVNRIQDAGDKAGNMFYRLLQQETTPETDVAARIEDVVDLTDKFKDGVLCWEVPEGRWRVFRFGYSLTGKTNHPATAEATGLEVDKLDPKAVRKYLETYLGTYSEASGGRLGGRGIQYLLTDSYEAGSQTWTGRMFEEFMGRKGYDLHRWLPALTGMILDNTTATERFLFDWRRAIGEMMAEYHYDLQNEVLRPYGMKRYTESHESWRSNLTDGMDCKRYAEVPMSAFWMQYNQGQTFNTRFEADIRESASVAHIYGQNIAAAESFTAHGLRDGAWVYSPAVLKPTADAALASGLNRFVIHTSVHQPVDDKFPGLGLGPYGQWFNRHQTWADKARTWTDYLSRSCYLLQQGRFVADVAYYYGEDNNVTGLFMYGSPEVPDGYNYDFFSPSVLLDLVRAEGGKIAVPAGMRYRILMLDPNVRYMSIGILRKLKELADDGIVICGSRPEVMAGNSGSQEEFDALTRSIWESGRKNVTCGVPAGEVLAGMGIRPDFEYSGAQGIKFVHRSLAEGDIYWVANLKDEAARIDASFRTSGKKPVIWHAEDGSSEPVSFIQTEGRTKVNLSLDRCQSVFVMFLEDSPEERVVLPEYEPVTLSSLGGPWEISFQAGRGAPDSAVLDELKSLALSDDPGIKYFSGKATYSKSFSVRKKDLMRGRIFLDLGEVRDIASVRVNGTERGTVFTHPFKVEITGALRKGNNKVEIEVTDVWHNRIVGDMQPGIRDKITYTPIDFFTDGESLLPSGLLGPVKLVIQR